MKNTTARTNRKRILIAKAQAGFSLVELLVVIAVIGIIAAIAIPTISSITGQATAAKTARNAQSVASVLASAQAAGYTNTLPTGVSAAMSLVTDNGGLQGSGAFSNSTFYVPLSDTEKSNIVSANVLSVSNNVLIYTAAP